MGHLNHASPDTLRSAHLGNPYYMQIVPDGSSLRLSPLAQVCDSSFPHGIISAVERLYILEDDWDDGSRLGPLTARYPVESSQWLEAFRPFTYVKDR
jgi:hypothetical protein